MASELQRDRLRADLGADKTSYPDPEVDDLFLRASESYPNNPPAQEAEARLIGIKQMLANAAKRTDYSKNASRESLSQIFSQLYRLQDLYQRDLDSAIADGPGGGAMWANMRPSPRRDMEFPDA